VTTKKQGKFALLFFVVALLQCNKKYRRTRGMICAAVVSLRQNNNFVACQNQSISKRYASDM